MPRIAFPAHPINPAPQASRSGGRRTLRDHQRPRSDLAGHARRLGIPARPIFIIVALTCLCMAVALAGRVF